MKSMRESFRNRAANSTTYDYPDHLYPYLTKFGSNRPAAGMEEMENLILS